MNGSSPSRHLRSATWASARCPFIARIQPRCDRMTVIGSFSIIADQSISRAKTSAGFNCVRRGSANLSFTAARSRLSRVRCRAGLSINFASSSRSFVSAARSRPISISSSLRRDRSRMFRIASACRSDSENSAIRTGLGSSSLRMIAITRSRLRKAARKPSSSSTRSSILPTRTWLRRTRTSIWKESQARRVSRRLITPGVRVASSTLRLSGKRISRSVSRKRLSRSRSESTVRARGSRIRRTCSSLSSFTSARIGSFLSAISWAICSISFAFGTP